MAYIYRYIYIYIHTRTHRYRYTDIFMILYVYRIPYHPNELQSKHNQVSMPFMSSGRMNFKDLPFRSGQRTKITTNPTKNPTDLPMEIWKSLFFLGFFPLLTILSSNVPKAWGYVGSRCVPVKSGRCLTSPPCRRAFFSTLSHCKIRKSSLRSRKKKRRKIRDGAQFLAVNFRSGKNLKKLRGGNYS